MKRLIKASELPGLVALSLAKTIKTHPAVGWVRANKVSNETVLAELTYLAKHPTDVAVKSVLLVAAKEPKNIPDRSPSLVDQDFQTISVQLNALGLINIRYAETTDGKMALFWNITPKGERLMFELRTVKSSV